MPRTSSGTRQVSGGGGRRRAGQRHADFELWREVSRTMIGLTTIVEMFAKRVRRADRLELAREMIQHSDELEARGRSAKRTRSPLPVLRVRSRGGGRPPRGCGRVAPERRHETAPGVKRGSPGAASLIARHIVHGGRGVTQRRLPNRQNTSRFRDPAAVCVGPPALVGLFRPRTTLGRWSRDP